MRAPEVVWLGFVILVFILTLFGLPFAVQLTIGLVLMFAATAVTFLQIARSRGGRYPRLLTVRALTATVIGSFIVYALAASPSPPGRGTTAFDLWLLFANFVFALYSAVAGAAWLRTGRLTVPRSPEALWALLALLALAIADETKIPGRPGFWLTCLVPVAGIVLSFSMLFGRIEEQDRRALLIRHLVVGFAGTGFTSLALGNASPALGGEAGPFVWTALLMLQMVVLAATGIAGWAILKRTSVSPVLTSPEHS